MRDVSSSDFERQAGRNPILNQNVESCGLSRAEFDEAKVWRLVFGILNCLYSRIDCSH